MHLDNELKALRPEVGRPAGATVAGHRRALDAAIAEGRTAPRRLPGGGQVRRLVAVAAVLAVVVAGGVGWWAASRGDDVRLDTGPAGTPAGDPVATVTADPATTVVAGAAVGDQSTPTVTFAPGAGSTCGPGTPLGSSLPAFLQLLPDEPDAAGPATFDAEGHLVTRRESGRFAVEALWPAPDRQLYAPDGAADEVSPRPYGSITVLGSHETGSDVTVSGATGGTTVLRVLISDPVAVDEACRYVQFTVTEDDAVIARFAYDLAAIGDESPLVDRGPLVVETRQVAEAPAETVPCGGADDNGSPPNLDETAVGPAAPTPAEALDAYLATPEAATFYRSGYVEMITPDGTYVYGARFEGDPSQWVTLVTVERVQGGWAATRVSASGC